MVDFLSFTDEKLLACLKSNFKRYDLDGIFDFCHAVNFIDILIKDRQDLNGDLAEFFVDLYDAGFYSDSDLKMFKLYRLEYLRLTSDFILK